MGTSKHVERCEMIELWAGYAGLVTGACPAHIGQPGEGHMVEYALRVAWERRTLPAVAIGKEEP